MKKLFISAFCMLSGLISVNAQNDLSLDLNANTNFQSNFFEKTSVDVAYGFATPFSPSKDIKVADYASFSNFMVGLGYDFNSIWGVRLSYNYQKFENKHDSNFGVNYNRIMAEATFSLMNALNSSNVKQYNQSRFDLGIHAGAGLTFAKSNITDANEKIINLQIGIKPTYSITDNINVFIDITDVFGFNQDFGYNGLSFSDKKSTSGNYLNAMIGFQYKFNN